MRKLFFLCIAVLLISGFHLYESKTKIGKEYSTDVKKCTDTDDDSIYVQGAVSIEYVSGEQEFLRDYCLDNNLFEYSCFEEKPRAPKVIRCKYTCSLGRCYDEYPTRVVGGQDPFPTKNEVRQAFLERKKAEEERLKRLQYFTDIAGNVIRLRNEMSVAVESCKEGDDGVDRYTASDIEITYANGEKEHFWDICREDTLFEYQCDKESPRQPEIIRCKLGCRNGICIDKYQPPAGKEETRGFLPDWLRNTKAYEELPEHLKQIYDKPINESIIFGTLDEERAALRKDYVVSCEETDAGKDIFKAGTLTIKYQRGAETFYEKCLDRFHVYEYACNNRYPRTAVAIRCPYGCEFGKCIDRS